MDSFVPPQAVRSNAKRGLELRAKHGRGGTAIGVARARDLSNGKGLSLSTINRMVSYFARHEVDKKGEGWGVDSAGYIAWLLWGGDAGRSWANGISNDNKKKDKATMENLTTAFFEIVKADKNEDGTLMVYGKATDDSLDIDQQICDAAWLDRAMPDWFKTGGNIREQHSNIAAGVAKEYEKKKDGHYIHALVVDPISVKKVDTGVLKGFSIGIKSPRVVRDQTAANGRIIDGQIVEVSLVDRPANPNAKLMLAKSVNGEQGLTKVEEFIEKKEPNYEAVNRGGGGAVPADKELYNRVKAEAKRKFDVYPSAYANAWLVREYKKRGGTYRKPAKKSADALELTNLNEGESMDLLISDVIEMSAAHAHSDLVKFDNNTYDIARKALSTLIAVEAETTSEDTSLSHLVNAVHHLYAWQGEEAEGEIMDENIELAAEKEMHSDDKKKKMSGMKPEKGETEKAFKERCKAKGMAAKEIDDLAKNYFAAEADDKKMKKTTDADAVEETEEEKAEEEKVEEEAPATEEISEEAISPELEAIVEKAVKSATESIRVEVASLVSAKEAAETKAATLESELAVAKSLAVAGGPSRTAKPVDSKINDNLTKAAIYRAKANATTDPLLVKGYKVLAEKYASAATDLTK